MTIEAFKENQSLGKHQFVSVGGGKIEIDGQKNDEVDDVYPHSTMDDIQNYCKQRHLRLDQYIDIFEGPEFGAYMKTSSRQC